MELTKASTNSEDIYGQILKSLKYDERGKCSNAYEIISDPKMLVMAYNSIKSKPGNMTEGIDSETVDGISAS